MKRRGLLAGAAALVAGVLAKVGAQPALATDGQPILAATTNTASNTTYLSASGGYSGGVLNLSTSNGRGLIVNSSSGYNGILSTSPDANGVSGNSTSGTGVSGYSSNYYGVSGFSGSSYGVSGSSPSNYGVYGFAYSATTSGVYGSNNNAAGTGVQGVISGSGTGVSGQSGSGRGVSGTSTSGSGVYGQSGSSYGVYGVSSSSAGIVGSSTNGPGLQGFSTSQAGLTGSSSSNYGSFGSSGSGVGLGGFSTSGNGGFFQTQSASQWACQVNNTQATAPGTAPGLVVYGDFAVVNGAKSAAVETSKGLSLLYAVESPISVFEDFGRAELSGGVAQVRLDPHFAETIDTSDYYVFLTARGPHQGLFVTNQVASGFTIRDPGAGTLQVDYRIVAQRKGVTADHRLKRLERPVKPEPVAGKLLVAPPPPGPIPAIEVPRPPAPSKEPFHP